MGNSFIGMDVKLFTILQYPQYCCSVHIHTIARVPEHISSISWEVDMDEEFLETFLWPFSGSSQMRSLGNNEDTVCHKGTFIFGYL